MTLPATGLLTDKHHGVLIAGVKLCTELCQTNDLALEHFRKVWTQQQLWTVFPYIPVRHLMFVSWQLCIWTSSCVCHLKLKSLVLCLLCCWFLISACLLATVKALHKFCLVELCLCICAACDNVGSGVEEFGDKWVCTWVWCQWYYRSFPADSTFEIATHAGQEWCWFQWCNERYPRSG